MSNRQWLACAFILIAAMSGIVVLHGAAVREEAVVQSQIRSMGEGELYIRENKHVFYHQYHQSGCTSTLMGIKMLGATSTDDHCVVFVASADNVTVERRTDGKPFRTFRLTGNIVRDASNNPVSAEGAVILVPADDASYIRNISFSLLEEQLDARERAAREKLNEEFKK